MDVAIGRYLRDYAKKKKERSLRDRKPSRHSGVYTCVRSYTNINLCQGKIWRVSFPSSYSFSYLISIFSASKGLQEKEFGFNLDFFAEVIPEVD